MDIIEAALEHTKKELMLPKIRASLEVDFEKARKAHDSIHQFMLIAPKLVPTEHLTKPKYSFKRNSAYIIYHWEIFDLAHRSLLEALSTFYNASFILLRATVELIIKGSFFECLAHSKYRENSSIIDKDKAGSNLKRWIREVIKRKPSIAKDFEKISVAIYDKIEPIGLDENYIPSTSKMLKQLIGWGICDGLPNAYNLIYGMYGKLSPNVHVLPDYTDMGRVLVSEEKPFTERKVMSKYLLEYLGMLHTIIDIGMVVTLNILKDNVQNFSEVRDNLTVMLKDQQFLSLGLQYTPKRIETLLKSIITNESTRGVTKAEK